MPTFPNDPKEEQVCISDEESNDDKYLYVKINKIAKMMMELDRSPVKN